MLRQAIDKRGFSLLELMVTLAIGSILLGLALPSFQSIMGNSQMSATANTLVFSLQSARSEAIKRSKAAGVCTSSNSLDANASCDAGGFAAGWIVYIDDNGDGDRDAAEELIMQVEERSSAFSFSTDTWFASQVYFNNSGYSSNAAGTPLSGQISIDYANGTELRDVIISANGHIRTETP
jgi:type IV fimbrial biogenesis protein FimT